ncbi:MAG: hypothetical protein HY889_07510 [Deltaproteobacteria bacterium]|nr:hypothetical protein [Deltaproteobacteria bacterium]
MGMAEDIDLLDSKIARLKVEYEQYFMKVLKREPVKLRDEIEKTILFYSNKNLTNTSYKFKYNSVVAKYNSYKQYWSRVLREIDEGTFTRKGEGDSLGLKTSPGKTAPERTPIAAVPSARPDAPNSEIEEVYRQYIDKRKECNEPTEGITVDTLARTIEKYKKQVEEQYRTKEIDLKVYVKDGKTRLTITPRNKPR